jgi:D-alanyl-lipoteichoic acid acyltransferase DltB (MBOAT superfamily)
MMPQFHAVSCRPNKDDFAVGLTLLIFGLFKKVVLADRMGVLITPIYEHSAAEGGTSLVLAWMAAVGFTLQIYFDFSGYSDMALGLARFFGIKLPQNFDSPLRATNIIDFWLRWHMTLTRFLTGYIYNPLALWLTRRRMSKGHGRVGRLNTVIPAFVNLLIFPTIITMLVSGLWHGAGYGFIIWGLLHGIYLTINHAWRVIAPRLWLDKKRYGRLRASAGWALTFSAVVFAMIFFRAPTMGSATDLIRGIIGLHGLGVAQAAETLHATPGIAGAWSPVAKIAIWISLLMFVVLAFPNTMHVLASYEPALGVKPLRTMSVLDRIGQWKPSVAWAVIMSAIAAVAVVSMGGRSEFLYWQF